MKKATLTILCLLMIISTVFCLAGCKSREQRLSEETAYEDAQMNAMNKKVVKCINEQDKEGLKKLFSKSAKRDIEDIDIKAEELIHVFKGNKIQSTNNDAHVTSGSPESQPLNITANCIFKLDNGKQYVGWISFCTMDDKNKENVGLMVIEICNCSSKELPENHMWNGINSGNPGIFIHYID